MMHYDVCCGRRMSVYVCVCMKTLSFYLTDNMCNSAWSPEATEKDVWAFWASLQATEETERERKTKKYYHFA